MTVKFSRSGVTSLRGKRTRRIDFRVTEETGDLLQMRAMEAGLPLSEYLNEVALLITNGVDAIEQAYIDRTRTIADALSGDKRSN